MSIRLLLLLVTIFFDSVAVATPLPKFFVGIQNNEIIESELIKVDLAALNYPKDIPYIGAKVDLNGDGVLDFFVCSHETVCGSGGCQFEIIDGKTGAGVGSMFGNSIYVFERKINGWPIINVYSHGSATSGAFTCLVFDGKLYAETSSVYLYSESVKERFKKYKAVPRL